MAPKTTDAGKYDALSGTVANALRTTKMYVKLKGAAFGPKLKAALDKIAPELDKVLKAMSAQEQAKLLDILDPVGFSPATAAKGRTKATAAKWEAPSLEDWEPIYEVLLDLPTVIAEVRKAALGNEESAQDLVNRKRKSRAPEAQSVQDIIDEDENFDPNDQPQPEKAAKTNTVGVTAADLSANKEVAERLARMTQNDASLTRQGDVALASAAASSKWDLPKPRALESEVKFDAQGVMRHTTRKLHTREKWMELAVRKLVSLKGQPEELQNYADYVEMMNALCENFPWSCIVQHDDNTRDRIKQGEITGFNVQRLHTDFLYKYGHTLLSSGGSGGGGSGSHTSKTPPTGDAGGQKTYGKQKTCNFFNSKRGCTKAGCSFPHKCAKCGGAHSRTECTK